MFLRRTGTGLALLLALAQGAAADVVDQQQTQGGSFMALLGNRGRQPAAQTIQVGVDGYLTEISLPLYSMTGSGWISIEIREHQAAGQPTGKVRASVLLNASDVPLWWSNTWTPIPLTTPTIPLPNPIAVATGMQFSVVVNSYEDVVWLLGPAGVDVYPSGDAWGTVRGNWVRWGDVAAPEDLAFQTTMSTRRTTARNVFNVIRALRTAILAIPSYRILSGSAGQQQLANECRDALADAKAGNLSAARAHLQFILDRSDNRGLSGDWFLDANDRDAIWLDTMNSWAMVGFLD